MSFDKRAFISPRFGHDASLQARFVDNPVETKEDGEQLWPLSSRSAQNKKNASSPAGSADEVGALRNARVPTSNENRILKRSCVGTASAPATGCHFPTVEAYVLSRFEHSLVARKNSAGLNSNRPGASSYEMSELENMRFFFVYFKPNACAAICYASCTVRVSWSVDGQSYCRAR